MEVQYDQEPFARPRYGCIVSEARHEGQRGEIKRALPFLGAALGERPGFDRLAGG